jgi:hypothetical protein
MKLIITFFGQSAGFIILNKVVRIVPVQKYTFTLCSTAAM